MCTRKSGREDAALLLQSVCIAVFPQSVCDATVRMCAKLADELTDCATDWQSATFEGEGRAWPFDKL